ncbi:MAG: YtxH domain-containing protein [Flavobacterium circumlabens]|uniref:YtxH domain-containing protein n=1 Tax=Flavobacterium circumlabens TaxID=2133765 RepID=A0A4Y7U9J1_9FLAO|nr:YtxH domain-containing protein [Flavobacterium circumlabens]TCN54719.1 YtxH-like protein [Flavobacterium circumlabens]TEB42911.1 YtxH domain-containing protein [Flavobacterium circumlabens]
MESGKLAVTLLAGVAIGAAIGVLFAPEKGEDLRNKLADLKSDYLGNLKDKITDFTGDLTGKNTPNSGSANQPV